MKRMYNEDNIIKIISSIANHKVGRLSSPYVDKLTILVLCCIEVMPIQPEGEKLSNIIDRAFLSIKSFDFPWPKANGFPHHKNYDIKNIKNREKQVCSIIEKIDEWVDENRYATMESTVEKYNSIVLEVTEQSIN